MGACIGYRVIFDNCHFITHFNCTQTMCDNQNSFPFAKILNCPIYFQLIFGIGCTCGFI